MFDLQTLRPPNSAGINAEDNAGKNLADDVDRDSERLARCRTQKIEHALSLVKKASNLADYGRSAKGRTMLQLIYTSTADPLWDQDIKSLCAHGSKNNSSAEITGVLFFENGLFLHVIEGPKAVVEDTFIRIISDPRHHALYLLSRRMVTRREFGDAAMIVLKPSARRVRAVAKIRELIETDDEAVRRTIEEIFEAGSRLPINRNFAGKGVSRGVASL